MSMKNIDARNTKHVGTMSLNGTDRKL